MFVFLGGFFVCFWGFFRPTREFFTDMETSPLPMKGCNFLTLFGIHDHWAVRVRLCVTPYCDTGNPSKMVISEDPWHSNLLLNYEFVGNFQSSEKFHKISCRCFNTLYVNFQCFTNEKESFFFNLRRGLLIWNKCVCVCLSEGRETGAGGVVDEVLLAASCAIHKKD